MKSFLLSDPSGADGFSEAVRQYFRIKSERPMRSRLFYYDTFDWLLYNNSRYLALEKDKLVLYKAPEDTPLITQKWARSIPPRFWTDLPAGELKAALRSLINVRALLPYGAVNRSVVKLRILNEDEKTVVFSEMKALRPESGRESVFLNVRPLRGYDREYSQFLDFLNDLGLEEVSEQAAFHLIEIEDRAPGDYSSRMRVVLNAEMTALQAVRSVLLALLEVAERNFSGMIDDIDTEFLHDFRVAIRRTRSVLSEIKGVYSRETTEFFSGQFRQIGKSTNRLRDLDVYLLQKDDYYDQLPDTLKPGLDTLFAKLAKQRSWEQKSLVRMIEGEEFSVKLSEWRDFLMNEPDPAQLGPNADTPVLILARQFIYKAFHKVIRLGIKITPKTPDEKLHKLRIECKRLRYLMEFFNSLFPPEEVNYLIRQLKKLQDNLGDFNDLSVHQQDMYEYLKEVEWTNKSAPTITAALGGLITSLNVRQERVREQFGEIFSEFSREENAAKFEALFKPLSP